MPAREGGILVRRDTADQVGRRDNRRLRDMNGEILRYRGEERRNISFSNMAEFEKCRPADIAARSNYIDE